MITETITKMFPRSIIRREIIITPCVLILFVVLLKIRSICLSCEIQKQPTKSIIFSNRSLNIEDDRTTTDDTSILCLNMGDYLDNEQNIPESPIIFSPTFQSPRSFRFPYRYSRWNSSTIIPRAMTLCEHNLSMHLLLLIDRICREHNITYYMSWGTLLGSLRHHDIIPWDDDLDIVIPYEKRQLFTDAFDKMNITLVTLRLYETKQKLTDYYKLFYKSSPNAGRYAWHFPFIDIFFYATNVTHIWNTNYPEPTVNVNDVFPLILRPLGQLWLPSPRRPDAFFSFDVFDTCASHYWDHRLERGKSPIRTKCDQLKDIYPFVEQNNKTDSVEILKINNTIIHTIIFK